VGFVLFIPEVPMPYITYIAAREIIPRAAFSVVGADISVANVDGSFNAATTDLSGLLDADWVLASGFADAANNGWFQLEADSTAAKIDTSSTALVDEVAGASVSLVGYQHGLGQAYSLEFDLSRCAPSAPTDKYVNRGLDLSPETLLHSVGQYFDCQIAHLDRDDLPKFDELFNSVIANETATFDAFGTVASPVKPIAVELDIKSYKPIPTGPRSYRIAFKVRKI
jgi:hypothetical protein